MDTRYLGYMRVRVDFPLSKPLMPSITEWIKGRGEMETTMRYENVPPLLLYMQSAGPCSYKL
jgi:hypothetical protein